MRWQILIPIVSIVSSCLALSVIWWATQRRKERESYYRYELSRLMVERYADHLDRFLAWQQQQQADDRARRRDALLLLVWTLLFGGLGVLIGLRFTRADESLFGWVPIGLGAGLAVYLVLTRKRAG